MAMTPSISPLLNKLPENVTAHVDIHGNDGRLLGVTTLARGSDGVLHATRLVYRGMDRLPSWYANYMRELRTACAAAEWVACIEVCMQWGCGDDMLTASCDAAHACFTEGHAPDNDCGIQYRLHSLHTVATPMGS